MVSGTTFVGGSVASDIGVDTVARAKQRIFVTQGVR